MDKKMTLSDCVTIAENNDLVIDTPVAFVIKDGNDYILKKSTRNNKSDTYSIGDTSDGYHTFNELYHHRAVLFSVICNMYSANAWKSLHHHDGSMYDDMFIVGIDTPNGPATYHYDIDPYWDMFNVTELENAPEWDGHTPDMAINRIMSLSQY